MPLDPELVIAAQKHLVNMNLYWMAEAANWEARQKSTARALAWAMIYASVVTVAAVSMFVLGR